jgi:hypothetical protein
VSGDPFGELGLSDDATAADVRQARRELAKEHHPDRGGEPQRMQAVNAAAAAALRRIAEGRARSPRHPGRGGRTDERAAPGRRRTAPGRGDPRWSGTWSDVPSFTVEALPVVTFEALLLAAASLGEVLDDDPPYRLDAVLGEPLGCWCRLELVPDAGASTVSLTVAPLEAGDAVPALETVRDHWIDALNRLDWD